MASDRAVEWVGRASIRLGTRLRPKKPPPADFPERLRDQRDLVRRAFGARWWEAVPAPPAAGCSTGSRW